MSPLLGGPGVACSINRLRRLEAGELGGDERERMEAHLAVCDRCREARASLADERRQLQSLLPFQDFAAGVAEKLARDERSARARRRWVWRTAPLALAACLVAAVFLVRPLVPLPGERFKGSGSFAVHVQDGRGVRELAPGDAVPPRSGLRISLHPAGRTFAAVLLQDADGISLLYAGRAIDGVLPGAFEWTGTGRAALVVLLDDSPIDTPALQAWVKAHRPDRARVGGARASVLVRELWRSQ